MNTSGTRTMHSGISRPEISRREIPRREQVAECFGTRRAGVAVLGLWIALIVLASLALAVL